MESLKSYEQIIQEIDKKLLMDWKPKSNPMGIKYVEVEQRDFGFGVKKIYGICKAGDFKKQ
jgi:translation elongation factor EF-1beta